MELMRTPPETRHAKSGDLQIAYQVVGSGPFNLVIVPGFVSHIEWLWEEPACARFLGRPFVSVGDPKGPGLIESLARPGGNLTGFMSFEPGISGKWMEMVKEVAPGVTRILFVGNPAVGTYEYYLAGIETAARAFNTELVTARVENATDLERSIETFASRPAERSLCRRI
jgi:hypothetical protein